MLQNRYGDHEFPVRDRWSNARVYREAARRRDPSRAALRGLLWVAPGILVLLALGSGVLDVADVANGDAVAAAGLGLLVLFVILVAGGLVIGTLVDGTVPRREQERYRRLTGTVEVTERQQQLLAMDAVSDHSIGGWNSSLDYGPAWSMMPADLRRQHEHDAKRSFFVTMPLFAVAPMRAQLDADHHVASAGDVELLVADALSDAGLSARFHRVLHGADGDRMIARLSSLTGVGEWDLRALAEPADGSPPRLLWAADAQRLIAVVRMAYLAEHLDAATAWRLIERAAEPAAGLFRSWDEYWADVRIGLAFQTDRLEVVQRFDENLEGLRAHGWPAARVDYPVGDVPDRLPVLPTDRAAAQDG